MKSELNRATLALGKLFAAYAAAQKVERETFAVYAEALADIPTGEFEAVVSQCIAECKFLPTVAEIRERWHALTAEIGQLDGVQAWGLVQKAIRQIGHLDKPAFADPLISEAVEVMGWRALCTSEAPAGVDRAQFAKVYDSLKAREAQVRRLTPKARALVMERNLLPAPALQLEVHND